VFELYCEVTIRYNSRHELNRTSVDACVVARGGTVILTENDSNDSKINMYIPKERQSTTVNDCVD
jgi:hypothetical protein